MRWCVLLVDATAREDLDAEMMGKSQDVYHLHHLESFAGMRQAAQVEQIGLHLRHSSPSLIAAISQHKPSDPSLIVGEICI